MKPKYMLLAGLFSVVTFSGHSQGVAFQAPASSYTITILGAVQKPGIYEFTAGQTVSLLRMLVKAQGTTKYAKTKAVEITRVAKVNPAGVVGLPEMFVVDVHSIAAGKRDDIELGPGDVINIPSLPVKEPMKWLIAGVSN